jgi:prephenate dehydrogenase
MQHYRKVTCIGAGFMSGSLAKDLREQNLADEVWALARNAKRADEIRSHGVFTKVTDSFEDAVRDAQIVIIATPVSTIFRYICETSEFCAKNGQSTLLMDIGSTTGEIMKKVCGRIEAGDDWLKSHFVSSHPLCGSELTGAGHAKTGVYLGAPCVLTAVERGDAFERAVSFWQGVGSRVFTMSGTEHDRILAYTSHLPHVLSFAYCMGVEPFMRDFTAGSYRDMTRIGRSAGDLWKDIFVSNREEILTSIETFKRNLDDLALYIERGDAAGLNRYFASIKEKGL